MKYFIFILGLIFSIKCAANPWEGTYYANHSDMQFGMAVKALQSITIPADAEILDIGCGNGRVTKYVSSLVPQGRVLGVDRSHTMVSKAQSYGTDSLAFMQRDAVSLGFREQFNYVVSFNCLHWVDEIQVALKEIYASLIPGGQALILIAPVQPRHSLHRVIDSVAKTERWNSYFDKGDSIFTLYTFAEWAALIEKSGLIPENLKLIDASLDYANEKVFAEWMAGWIPFGTIPEAERQEYLQAIVNAYIAATPCEPDGKVHFRLEELIIVASKPTEK